MFAETNTVGAAATYAAVVFCETGLEGATTYGVDVELEQDVLAGTELNGAVIVGGDVELKQDVVFSIAKLVGAAAYGGDVTFIAVVFAGTDIVRASEHADLSRKQRAAETE